MLKLAIKDEKNLFFLIFYFIEQIIECSNKLYKKAWIKKIVKKYRIKNNIIITKPSYNCSIKGMLDECDKIVNNPKCKGNLIKKSCKYCWKIVKREKKCCWC